MGGQASSVANIDVRHGKPCSCQREKCPGRRNNKLKGSEVRLCMTCLRNNMENGVFGIEYTRGKGREMTTDHGLEIGSYKFCR